MDLRSFLSRVGQKQVDAAALDDLHSADVSENDSDDGPVVSIRKKKSRPIVPEFRSRLPDEAKGVVVSLLPTSNTARQPTTDILSFGDPVRNKSTFVAAMLRQKRNREPCDDDVLRDVAVDQTCRADQLETIHVQSYVSSGSDIINALGSCGAQDDFAIEATPLLAHRSPTTGNTTRSVGTTSTADAPAVPAVAVDSKAPRRRGLLEAAKTLARDNGAPAKSKTWQPQSHSF